ncbi:2-haloalkanoic acid dehalogenase [Planktothrix tepida]|uniref:Haloacid dehalogenase, type II:HAD-superfamily hydrolase, subfamilyIA, variant 2 n=2 Tax=Planktothrix TaxID=54304 RepID=A0A1J1LGS2_9CYAN|nr:MULTISPECIES: haloacid dehalogenase type II [Planktothrix]CAD5932606.1 2-haloalkanoic acid dehalogenase [Planktothrix tepida]CAD5978166.1 2-haloalkanoic acid dehalogenase [Planktothrix pseudagardhii]CUR31680.1 Haloacid dehalogenase, type II:HAD-superfamily hydrolase, subfamilyIA, variant 2 [Planktothrix tepida PCC 9214]
MIQFNQFTALSFDCYGTLIDWESGITPVLQQLVKAHGIKMSNQELLELFAILEPEAQSGDYKTYREILREVVQKFGERLGFSPTPPELESLANSIQDWQPFSDTVEALKALKQKYKLVIISNIDDDLFAQTNKHLQIEFDHIITAQQAQSYKPSPHNFEFALNKTGLSSHQLLHIAQSIFHDIATAKSLGLTTVWVNRRQGKPGGGATKPATAQPDLEVPDLKSLVNLIFEN